jgi:hypothetical protein
MFVTITVLPGLANHLNAQHRWLRERRDPVRVSYRTERGSFCVVTPQGHPLVVPADWCEIVDSEEPLFARIRDREGFVARAHSCGFSPQRARELAAEEKLWVCRQDGRHVSVWLPGASSLWVPMSELDLW